MLIIHIRIKTVDVGVRFNTCGFFEQLIVIVVHTPSRDKVKNVSQIKCGAVIKARGFLKSQYRPSSAGFRDRLRA